MLLCGHALVTLLCLERILLVLLLLLVGCSWSQRNDTLFELALLDRVINEHQVARVGLLDRTYLVLLQFLEISYLVLLKTLNFVLIGRALRRVRNQRLRASFVFDSLLRCVLVQNCRLRILIAWLLNLEHVGWVKVYIRSWWVNVGGLLTPERGFLLSLSLVGRSVPISYRIFVLN